MYDFDLTEMRKRLCKWHTDSGHANCDAFCPLYNASKDYITCSSYVFFNKEQAERILYENADKISKTC